MYRLPLLLLMSLTAPLACAEDLPALPFNTGHPAPFLTDFKSPAQNLAPATDDTELPATLARERRAQIREQLLDALGLSRFVPSGRFTTRGHEGRWSLGLHDERTVSLRVRLSW